MLELTGITKAFGAVQALDGVDVSFAPGEVHAVLGENGAGKSTLMKVLYGLLRPDAGRIRLDGRELRLRRPADAQAAGIGMVHQHFMLAEALSVAENILLGRRDSGFWMPRSMLRRRARELSLRFGLDVDPDTPVADISVGQRQRVEVLKALACDARTLILDEPTAVLTLQETEQLFASLRALRNDGRRIVFISHKLDEVLSISDRVTVLRAGRRVCTEPTGTLTADDLAERMIGARLTERPIAPASRPGEEVLRLIEVHTRRQRRGLRGLNLVVCRGEIVGIAGVDGNGQMDLARTALGLQRATSGTVEFRRGSARASLAHITDDRHREALVLSMSVAENAALKDHGRPPLSRRAWLNRSAIDAFADRILRDYDIRAAGLRAAVSTLSGGNQQRLVVARELARRPELIVAVNPTRGLDVAAGEFVHRRLAAERDRGAAVLLISADLDEILRLADRICVLCDGRLSLAPGPPFDVAAIGRLMAGRPASGTAA